MRPPDIVATELARGLRRYQAEQPKIHKQNRAQVRILCRDGDSLSAIIARTPRVHKYDDELAVAIAAQWALDAIGDFAREERAVVEALLRAAADYEKTRRVHDCLVEKLDPDHLADVLNKIAARLPIEEQDDQPALEKALEILACDNGIEGITQTLQKNGFAPGPVLTAVYGRHLDEMREIEAGLEERRRQRCDCAGQLQDLRSGCSPHAASTVPVSSVDRPFSAKTDRGHDGPSRTATGAVRAHRRAAPQPPPWEKLPEAELATNFAAEKKAMRSRLKTLKAQDRSLHDILLDAPIPAADRLDDSRACALVELWIEKTIGPVADDEKEVVARLVDNARQYEVLRRAREVLVRAIDAQKLALLLEANDARLRASNYIAMAEALLARPDCIAGLRTWMGRKSIPAEPALIAIFGDRLSDVEDLEEALVEPVIERALAALELEYMRLSRGDPAYPVERTRTPVLAERASFQEILVRDLDRRVKVEEGGRARLRSRRELVVEAATKIAPRSRQIFDLLREMHARGPRHRTEDSHGIDFRPIGIAICESRIEELRKKREARERSEVGKSMRRRDDDKK